MQRVQHTLELSGPACEGRLARPAAIAAVLDRVHKVVMETVRMAFLRSSRSVGRPLKELSGASDIRCGGQTTGPDRSTSLLIEAPRLVDAAPHLFEQGQLWEDTLLPSDTALDLVGDLLSDIYDREGNSYRFDTPLLESVGMFRRALKKGVERIVWRGDRLDRLNHAVIDREVLERAASMIEGTPPPRRVRVSGKLDMIRVSDRAFELVVQGGERVRALWAGDDIISIRDFLNQIILIEGDAVFRPSGHLLRVDAQAIRTSNSTDSVFSEVPVRANPIFNIQRDVRQPARPETGFAGIYGKWPGDETESEVLLILEELS